MSIVNTGLTKAADVLMAPFAALHPMISLTVVSLVTAVAMLFVFKRTSDQARLASVKRSIHAALFEIRLFNDDLAAIMRAQLEILRHNATYLRLSLVPMLWVIVPLVLVIAQLQFLYGYAALEPGEGTLLKVQLRDALPDDVSIDAPPQLHLDTPAVRLPAAKEVVWRLRPTAGGEYDVRVKVGSDTYTKRVQVAGGVVRRSPVRVDGGLLNQLLYPSEPPLPDDAPVTAITVAYHEQDLEVYGVSLNWMVWYFVLSLVFAFALRKPFGVTI